MMFAILLVACQTKLPEQVYKSESLIINQISDHTYQHITYLQTNDYGKVACNGMLVIDGNEALVFDTPSDDQTAEELIAWIESEQQVTITAVVPTHFHKDCLGGLKAFHDKEIQSIAHNKTIQLLDSTAVLTWQGFDDRINLSVGQLEVVVDFVGEGHTADNVIAYVPSDQAMFGGCLIKSLKAGTGNLEDANVQEWTHTVDQIKAKYPETRWVIPGHGAVGGQDLLDYTGEMFRATKQ